MALVIHKEFPLARLIDSENDNPMELTVGYGGPGRVNLHLEDRDAGEVTKPLSLDRDELMAALALVALPKPPYVED